MAMTAVVILAVVAGLGAGYVLRLLLSRRQSDSFEKQAQALLQTAKREAEATRKEARVQAKDEVLRARETFEKSTEKRKRELAELEERIGQRELNLDRKVSMIDKKEQAVDEKIRAVEEQNEKLKQEREALATLTAQERAAIQRVAGMTEEEARQTLMERLEKDVQADVGSFIRRKQEQAKETAERESRNIIATAIQRYASSHASEMMTSSVALPSDDIKGRIIGREGRNIRALEAATGVNILIDDTPEAVVISGFDPIRRETAKLALESLIADGRIHPARIEEVVEKVQANMEETVRSVGEEALYQAGIQDVAPELVRRLGRLKYRTSYSQNVLQHSMEVSQLMGVMAGELNLDVSLARRIGLFHDIGKALDHEVEGGHAIIGADLLKRHSEGSSVVNAVAAHHEEVAPESIYAHLCAGADAISSSRVGARSETTEIYIKRLEKLEAIANGFEGVRKSYAIQAGREVRMLVDPEKMDDNASMVLARDVSKKIESDLHYPGQIKVIVIRETRCVEYAR
jgi:ribonuclease Y